MSILYKIPVILYLLIPSYLCAGNPTEIAQGVLDRLYKAHGHFNPKKPKLQLVSSKENVASYLKYNNTIQLEEQAYLLCRSFGKDSLSVLAFLLGHELIHAIQIHNVLPKTSFISYHKSLKSSLEIEQNADIQGIFVSYLAGFNTIELIPQIIERMYTVYGLRSKNIRGYPTEEERKSSYKDVKEQAKQLIELFNLSNELAVIEEYQTSIQCLEYITRLYQGKEVYNNLGVNYTLMALNFTGRNTESYIYPLELDWNSRIKKPKSGRGEEELDPIIRIKQQQLFLKAKIYFSLASDLDPDYTQADLNIFCVHIMMNELDEARQFYRNHLRGIANKKGNTEIFLKIKSANAILSAKLNNSTEALKIWNDLLQEKNKIIAVQAEQNISNLTKNRYLQALQPILPCASINKKEVPEVDRKLRNLETNQWIQLDSMNSLEKNKIDNSTIYACIVDGSKIFQVQKIPVQSKLKLDVKKDQLRSLGNNQWIYICKKESIAYILNEQEEAVTIIRYLYF